MKKFVRNTIGAFMALSLVAGAISCSDGLDESDPFVEAGVVNKPTNSSSSGNVEDLPADEFDTVEVTEMTGVETSWGDTDNLKVGPSYASQLTVGSKIYFDVDKYDNGSDGAYLKFHIDNGSWGDVGVTEYFNADGTKVAGAEEDTTNAGVYNIDVNPGLYYIEVTDSNINKLKAGFALHGNATIKKVTLKIKKGAGAAPAGNQESQVEQPGNNPTGDDAIELVEPAAKDGYYTFWAQSSGAAKGSVEFVLNYESGFEKDRTTATTDPKKLVNPTYNKSVTLKNVSIKYIINDGEEKEYKAESIELPINQWGTDYQAKVPVFADYKVTKNDAIYVKITATVNDEKVVQENGTSIIQGNLIDTDASVDYWKEMCAENQQKQLLSGITYEAATPTPEPAPQGEPTTPAPAAEPTYTEVWTGEKTIDWADNGLTIDHAKFPTTFNAVRITYNATAGALKMAVCDPWTDITATAVSAGSIADDGAINLPTGDAQSVVVTMSDAAVAGIIGQGKDGAWGGAKIFGADTITITKVEAVKN